MPYNYSEVNVIYRWTEGKYMTCQAPLEAQHSKLCISVISAIDNKSH